MIHCETWASSPGTPYGWLLWQDEAPTARLAVRKLCGAASWLADRLDDFPEPEPAAQAALWLWATNTIAQEDVADQLTAGKYVAEAVSVDADGVRYTLTAMPAHGCVCRPLPFTTATGTTPFTAAHPEGARP